MPVGEKDVLPATDAAPEDLDDPELHDPDAEPGWMYTILNLPLIGEKIGGFLAIAPPRSDSHTVWGDGGHAGYEQ